MPPRKKTTNEASHVPKKYYAVRVGRHSGIYITWPEAQKEVIGFVGAVYKSFHSLAEAQEYMHTAVSKLRGPDTKVKPETITDLDKLLDVDINTNLSDNPQTEADLILQSVKTCEANSEQAGLRSTPDDWTYYLGEFYLATDGSFNTKSRRSGWAVYLGPTAYNPVQEMPRDTTNNRCELLAIKSALDCVLAHLGHPLLQINAEKQPIINIVSDSQLCVLTFTKWITGWKKKGWRLASGGEPANLSEVQEIDRQLELIRSRQIQVNFIHQHAHTSSNRKFKTKKDELLWQINYIVDILAQRLTN
jgi:ribonuclease HI